MIKLELGHLKSSSVGLLEAGNYKEGWEFLKKRSDQHLDFELLA